MSRPSTTKTIKTVAPYSVGRFAIFRHASKTSKNKFSVFHDTWELAEAEVTRLLADDVATYGEDVSYYIVEVKAAFRYVDKKFSQDLKFEPA